jgi:hypothetical protein
MPPGEWPGVFQGAGGAMSSSLGLLKVAEPQPEFGHRTKRRAPVAWGDQEQRGITDKVPHLLTGCVFLGGIPPVARQKEDPPSSAGVDEAIKRTAVEAYATRTRQHQAREPALAGQPVECIEADAQVVGGPGTVQEPDIGWQGLSSLTMFCFVGNYLRTDIRPNVTGVVTTRVVSGPPRSTAEVSQRERRRARLDRVTRRHRGLQVFDLF